MGPALRRAFCFAQSTSAAKETAEKLFIEVDFVSGAEAQFKLKHSRPG
jgi:hypothetical protein